MESTITLLIYLALGILVLSTESTLIVCEMNWNILLPILSLHLVPLLFGLSVVCAMLVLLGVVFLAARY